eukprot:Nk52_evm89s2118 gene=Nk52_evmTU89s2118
MAVCQWLDTLKESKKTALMQDGRKKIHLTLANGAEVVEEYDAKTGELMLRKLRSKTTFGASGKWEFEIGEPPKDRNESLLLESNANPMFYRRDTPSAFQWRIRNLPYPKNIYELSVDKGKLEIVLRTSNKKYFKRITIPDLKRCGFAGELCIDDLSYSHANNTLIISYKKPVEVINFENQWKQECMKIKAGKDGDVDCNPS